MKVLQSNQMNKMAKAVKMKDRKAARLKGKSLMKIAQ